MTQPYLFTAAMVAFSLLFGCASSSKDASNNPGLTKSGANADYQKVALQKYQKDISYSFNSEKSYVICTHKSKQPSPRRPRATHFFIYDIKNNTVLFEDAQARAKVRWINPFQVEVAVIPGIVKGDESEGTQIHGYIYDIKQGRKLALGLMTK